MVVGAYEAKTRLSELLARVAGGERVTITKHGVPVAVLQPPDPAPRKGVAAAIQDLRGFRQALRARGALARADEIRDWIEEGRE